MVSTYVITVLISYVLSTLAQRSSVYNERTEKRNRNVFVYLLILLYIILLGFRYLNYKYSDEWIYRQPAIGPTLTWSMVFRTEGLGTILAWLSENTFSSLGGAFEYGQFYILSTSVIVSFLFVLSMWDYSPNFPFSVFLFVTLGFAFTAMNIIRQFVAVAILFYGHRYMISRKFGKYAFMVILAMGFHTSALIMLPVYFLLHEKKMTKWMYLMIATAVLLFGQIDSIGSKLLGDSIYGSYFMMTDAYGVSILRILAYAVPIVLILLNRKIILDNDIRYTSFVNMMVFVLVILIFSLQNVYYNRISYYFTGGCLIVFPLIPYVVRRNASSLVKQLMVILFFLFGLYQAYISVPYHNILFENITGVL